MYLFHDLNTNRLWAKVYFKNEIKASFKAFYWLCLKVRDII